MKYFEKLGLIREPFSNSPDPRFLFSSRQHVECLQHLEIAIRLRRGLNVVIGDIGTGKTTLCRRLVSNLAKDSQTKLHLLLDPSVPSPRAFLRVLATKFTGKRPPAKAGEWQLKEAIKQAVFRRGVRQGQLTVLIIDEAQKIKPACLEILRELLNYETNSSKLLQIVIFGQKELEAKIRDMPNFFDRINYYKVLSPLTFIETKEMINYRLAQAVTNGQPPRLFTLGGAWAVYRATGGYPRRIVMLCHKALLSLLVDGKARAGWSLVRACADRAGKQSHWLRWSMASALATCLVLGALAWQGGHLAGVEQSVRAMLRAIPASARAATEPGPTAPELAPVSAEPAEQERQEAPARPEPSMSVAEAETGTPRTASAQENMDPAQVLARLLTDGMDDVPLLARPESKPPASLGTVSIGFRENYSVMIKNIYGVYDRYNHWQVANANPGLGNTNAIEVGTSIEFPNLIGAGAENPGGIGAGDVYWVQLANTGSLDEAYRTLRRVEFFQLDSRILPYWYSDCGLRFAVVLGTPFARGEGALGAYERLPLAVQTRARVLRLDGQGAVFLGQLDRASRAVAMGEMQ